MTEPYRPPEDPEDRLIEIALDGNTSRTRSVLWFCGVIYVLFGILFGPLFSTPLMRDPSLSTTARVAILATMVTVSCATGVGFGVFNLVTAAGLARGAKWAWVAAVMLGALYVPSACLPFGAVILYGMLNDKTRRLFLG